MPIDIGLKGERSVVLRVGGRAVCRVIDELRAEAANPEIAPALPRRAAPAPAVDGKVIAALVARELAGDLAQLAQIVAAEVVRRLPLAALPQDAPTKGTVANGYWPRLADVIAADLGEHAAAEVLGTSTATLRSWRAGRTVPGDAYSSEVERLAVVLLAVRRGVDEETLDDARRLLRDVQRRSVDVAAWQEVVG